jgi:hypothetical protein
MDTDAIIELERERVAKFRRLTLEERGKLVSLACRAAAEIEASRIKMGLPPTQPEPWPESTWRFLREAARRCREQTSQPDCDTEIRQ